MKAENMSGEIFGDMPNWTWISATVLDENIGVSGTGILAMVVFLAYSQK